MMILPEKPVYCVSLDILMELLQFLSKCLNKEFKGKLNHLDLLVLVLLKCASLKDVQDVQNKTATMVVQALNLFCNFILVPTIEKGRTFQ